MSEEKLAVSLRGITNRFGEQIIHQDLDLDIRQGEVLGLIGASGTGKSVLLRTIIGLQKQVAGEVLVCGMNPSRAGQSLGRERKIWSEARRLWGVLFQDGALFSSLTVRGNIEVPLRLYYKIPSGLLNELTSLKISLVGLPPEAGDKYPSELSGGMRKRAGLARALALDPALLLLDEPTSGLDPIAAASFDRLLKTLSRSLGLTVLLVTHDIDSLYTVCDRVAVLAEKRILAVDNLEGLLRIEHPWLREYFKGPRGRAAAAALRTPGIDESNKEVTRGN